jgi:hypothetical protein
LPMPQPNTGHRQLHLKTEGLQMTGNVWGGIPHICTHFILSYSWDVVVMRSSPT